MGSLENLGDIVSEIGQGVRDVATDVVENVADFSKEALEHFDGAGIKELNAGNLEGALDNSNFSDKEGMKEVAKAFHLDKNVLMAGTRIAGGLLTSIAAWATPGFQASGLAGLGSVITGIHDFKKAMDDGKSAKAAELNEYGAA